MGMHTPARCTQCGLLFEQPNLIGGTGGAQVTFSNVGTNCPRCGGLAQVLDGTYSLQDGLMELVSGPQSTVELFRTLEAVIQQSRAKGDSPEQTAAKVAEAAPWLGALRQKLPTFANATAFVSMVAGIAQLVVALKTPSLSIDDAKLIVRETVAQIEQKRGPPLAPTVISPHRTNPKPKQHDADSVKRVPDAQYKATQYQGQYKKRAKRRH